MKQLLRQMLVLILVGVRRSKLTMDAVRQLEAGAEGVDFLLVVEAVLRGKSAEDLTSFWDRR